MDWIRLHRRFAIYHRDGFDCLYCQGLFEVDQLGYGLTLDHVEPTDDNAPRNLVTACHDCNSTKRDQTLDVWLDWLLEHKGIEPEAVRARLAKQLVLPLNLNKGLQLAQARRPKYRAGNYVKHYVPGGGRRPMRESA